MNEKRENEMWDAVIVGGGPAGLSAGLILGRCRRRVLVCDTGRPRNWASERLSGFLTRDGTPPAELWRIAREQLGAYSTVAMREVAVIDAHRQQDGFEVVLDDGDRLFARKLLLSTGVVDDLPDIDGAETFYGRGVFHCPYCDGWEMRDQPLAVYGRGSTGKELALELTVWSRDLVLCTDGPPELSPKDWERLEQTGVAVCETAIARFEGSDGRLERIRFQTGDTLPRRGVFFSSRGRQASDLAERLGCGMTPKGAVDTGAYETTCVPGVYIAGDASRNVQLAIVAAAEGAMAAFAINTELLKEDLASAKTLA